MSTAILTPLTGSSYQLLNSGNIDPPDQFTAIGDVDLAVCMQVSGDGKYAHNDNTVSVAADVGVGFALNAGTQLPVGATINGVAIVISHRSNDAPTGLFPVIYTADHTPIDIAVDVSGFSVWDEQTASGFSILCPSTPYETWNVASFTPGNINPITGLVWTRADLISLSIGLDANRSGPPGTTYDIDYFAFIVDYTGGGPTNPCFYNPLTNQWVSVATKPDGPWFERGCPDVTFSLNPVFGSVNGGD